MGEASAGGAPKTIALVLVGSVAQGAFEAGAIEVLGQRRIEVRRIVAASSGALNGTVLAAAIRAGRQRVAGAELSDAWRRHGGLASVLRPSLRSILELRGLSDQRKLLDLLRRHAPASDRPRPAPIELAIVVAPLFGVQRMVGGEPAVSYSQTLTFRDEDFDSPDRIDRVHRAATASAALPPLFTPVDLPGLGPCIDGGIVYDAPILHAFGPDHGASLDAILVVTPTPARARGLRAPYRGLELVFHTLEMVFAEWVFQDLRRSVLLGERVVAPTREETPSFAAHEAARGAPGRPDRGPPPIILIHPEDRLPGTLFSGFTDASLRRRYVDIGIRRAREVLDRLGWE